MRNLYLIVFVCFLTFVATSCQRIEINPNFEEVNNTTSLAQRTEVLSAPNNFVASNISTNQDITFSWDEFEGEEGYELSLYSNEGGLINTYSIDEANTHQYTVNGGQGSFKAVLRRKCEDGVLSDAAETAATACCGGVIIQDDEADRIIQNGQSTCLEGYEIESYTLTSSQNLSTLSVKRYIGVTDYVVMYGYTNSTTGTPTTYNMIPMSNILTVNAANTSMIHTLQLDFQNYQYCKVFFIPWKLANCSVL